MQELETQQIQKHERGTNAVASTRIPDLCRALEMTPNDSPRGPSFLRAESRKAQAVQNSIIR
jgi:hypothetical protein